MPRCFSEQRNESLAAGLSSSAILASSSAVAPTTSSQLVFSRAAPMVASMSIPGWSMAPVRRPSSGLLHGSPEALGHPGYRNGLFARSLEQLGRVLGLHCKLQSGTVEFGQLQISTDRRSGNDRGFMQRKFPSFAPSSDRARSPPVALRSRRKPASRSRPGRSNTRRDCLR